MPRLQCLSDVLDIYASASPSRAPLMMFFWCDPTADTPRFQHEQVRLGERTVRSTGFLRITWYLKDTSQLVELWDQIVDAMNSSASFLQSVSQLHFGGFTFDKLPFNPGKAFARVSFMSFMDCPNLVSLHTAVKDCANLKLLMCALCSNLKSLASLSSLLPNVKLKAIFLQDNTSLLWLPWNLHCLEDASQIHVDRMPELENAIRAAGAIGATRDGFTYVSYSVKRLKPYFKQRRRRFCLGVLQLAVLLQRSKYRAMERLFAPGGRGYESARADFRSRVEKIAM